MITRLSNDTSLRSVFEKIGVDCGGQGIMAKKGEQFLFYISGLNIKAANILKQDALSIGADLAVSKDMASMSADFTNALLICNKSQLEKLIKKESIQPFGLKKNSRRAKGISEFKQSQIPADNGYSKHKRR